MDFFKLLIFSLSAILLSFAQFLPIAVFGVKPNLPLAGLIVLSFFVKDTWQSVFLAGLSAAVLKFSPQPSKEILVFFAVVLAAFLIKKSLPWHNFVSTLFLIVLATAVFYLALYPKAILSVIFPQELFYNLFFGAVIFWAASLALKPSRRV